MFLYLKNEKKNRICSEITAEEQKVTDYGQRPSCANGDRSRYQNFLTLRRPYPKKVFLIFNARTQKKKRGSERKEKALDGQEKKTGGRAGRNHVTQATQEREKEVEWLFGEWRWRVDRSRVNV